MRIYTDGSSMGNPGPGGAAIVVVSDSGEVLRTFSKSYPETTNNRMELTAAIAAVKYAVNSGQPCEIISDSQYVVFGITDWTHKWAANGWKRKGGPIENLDLWQKLYGLVTTSPVKLRFVWVRGHVGEPGNELANQLAQKAAGGQA